MPIPNPTRARIDTRQIESEFLKRRKTVRQRAGIRMVDREGDESLITHTGTSIRISLSISRWRGSIPIPTPTFILVLNDQKARRITHAIIYIFSQNIEAKQRGRNTTRQRRACARRICRHDFSRARRAANIMALDALEMRREEHITLAPRLGMGEQFPNLA